MCNVYGRKATRLLKMVLGCLLAAGFGLRSQPATAEAEIVGVASVIDGDTIDIHGQRIRIWDIDAPESAQLCYVDGKPWRCGQRASFALSDWIGRRTVACKERDRDRYGRFVATCAVVGDDMATWPVRHGWALDWPRYSHGAYAGAEREATTAKVGVWQGDFQLPWEWRRAHRN